jgi:hypothetical protein
MSKAEIPFSQFYLAVISHRPSVLFALIFDCKDTTKIAHTQVNNENIVQKEEILYFEMGYFI